MKLPHFSGCVLLDKVRELCVLGFNLLDTVRTEKIHENATCYFLVFKNVYIYRDMLSISVYRHTYEQIFVAEQITLHLLQSRQNLTAQILSALFPFMVL